MSHPATVYDLLISSPSDVLFLKKAIDGAVEEFNNKIGLDYNALVKVKHWTEDSFPESGGKPQALLNKQFVDDCDFCVAIFGNRFGTPTEEYGSGTEEEIEKMLLQKKQVFLYFYIMKADPATFDEEQYKKVQEYKDKYKKNKGIYWDIESEEHLRKQFLGDLTKYFKYLKKHTSGTMSTPMPNLIISSRDLTANGLALHHTSYQFSKEVDKKRDAALETINKIKEIIISANDSKNNANTQMLSDNILQEMNVGELGKAFKEGLISPEKYYTTLGCDYVKVKLSSSDKEVITTFSATQSVPLDDDFFDLGGLGKAYMSSTFHLGITDDIKGTSFEKAKYSLLKKLLSEIRYYTELLNYFKTIDSFYYASLYISNIGKSYDKDIDIKICVDKGHIINVQEIPQPDTLILKDIVEQDLPKELFSDYNDSKIADYLDYPRPDAGFYLPKRYQEQYSQSLENLFCYNTPEDDEEDVLCFNISYLKQNTNMFFPTLLFFKSIPQYIRYEIRSMHSPDVYENKYTVTE